MILRTKKSSSILDDPRSFVITQRPAHPWLSHNPRISSSWTKEHQRFSAQTIFILAEHSPTNDMSENYSIINMMTNMSENYHRDEDQHP